MVIFTDHIKGPRTMGSQVADVESSIAELWEMIRIKWYKIICIVKRKIGESRHSEMGLQLPILVMVSTILSGKGLQPYTD